MTEEQLRQEFGQLLKNDGERKKYKCEKYHSNVRHTRNIIELVGSVNCVIYFHIRTGYHARWGITTTRIGELKSSGKRWAVVLLYRSPDRGYLLDMQDVEKSIGEHIWPIGKDNKNKNEYKISGTANDTRCLTKTLKYAKPFRSFDEFYSLLFNI